MQTRLKQNYFRESSIVLDLCGGTGSWSEPYRKAGYDVRLITLPDHDVCDYMPPKNVYGILAAPPCTMFSYARQRAIKPRDFKAALQVVDACVRIAWVSNPVFFALENPVSYLKQWLGEPAYTFQPWEFGSRYSKKTALWGYFNKPIKIYGRKEAVMTQKDIELCYRNSRPLPKGLPCKDARSLTPPEFAKAFYECNNHSSLHNQAVNSDKK